MLKHILTIAFRSIKKHKSSFVINLAGLSTGLAFSFLLYLWVQDEKSIDKFHVNDNRLYQVMVKSTENGIIRIQDHTQGPLSEAMEKDLPEVDNAVTVMNLSKEGMDITLKNGEKTFKTGGIFSGEAFFKVFTFPLISGNSGTILKEKNNIVISENLALKLYGTVEAALGKPLQWNVFGSDHISSITGVFENVSSASTLKFDFVLTKQKLIEDIWQNGKQWSNTGPETYLLLKEGVNLTAFNKKIERYIDKYDKGNHFSLFVRKYSDAYLYGNYEDGEQVGERITNVRLFSVIAILLLVIASINFMNLSTAKVSGRLKEIGIKKTVGSGRRGLIYQFLGESLFVTALATVIALALAVLVTPQFNFITGKQLSFHFSTSQVAVILLIAFVTGVLSGSYPAFYLSGFKPLATLKGKLEGKAGELFVRKGLVIFQFIISLVLIVSVIIVYQQIEFAQTKPVGYAKENVVYFEMEGKIFENKKNFFDELRRVPGVVQAGGINQSLIREDGGSSTYGVEWPGKIESKNIDFMIRTVDESLVPTLGMAIKEGKSFSDSMGSNNSYLLLNETAVKVMGLKEPVGTRVKLWGEEKTILGVMKDFHTASVHQPISPLLFRCEQGGVRVAMVRIQAGSERKVVDNLTAFYSKVNPGYVLNLNFLDETFKAQYLTEERTLTLAKYFAYLTILISCLGLFGLAAFDTERRTKEIGIRKVLGANVSSIVAMISGSFIKLVLVSVVMATPVAWFFMSKWLEDFAYRINIGWWVFILAGIIAVVIAFATVGFQALKAAIANPVKSLRTE
ncbi:MAG TPA: FtsX-like permease family protein [Chitinophagaceae bacterium]|nr:FtsX-like permease family protein [Chitinophagaceae bacterium]